MAATNLGGATLLASLTFQQPSGNINFPATLSKALKWQQAFATGVGLAQANRLAVMQFTIAASGTLLVDVSAGTFSGGTFAGGGTNVVDLNGVQITFARLKALAVNLLDKASGSTGVHLNPAAANAALTLAGKVKAGGLNVGNVGGLLWFDPTAAGEVVDGTHKIIAVVNDDAVNPATVNLGILGGAT